MHLYVSERALTSTNTKFNPHSRSQMVNMCLRGSSCVGRVDVVLIVCGTGIGARVTRCDAANCQSTIEVRQTPRADAYWLIVSSLPDDFVHSETSQSRRSLHEQESL